ncbi:phytanoyl-CoA dioxygenase family protein [Oharaeibacter diazotrophicus]|uniref:Phytanoyl-CoA dioxygenase PhyH n=1 Tax=Oharaeibacter diazotrophicus TaxID=1920512 RepID=A0A4R6RNP2_9HYPH|nr:phytanoyl-CoA dioxygenase family protein [Oharaeibacter diazotrophicus]TDP87687.1 phytanoyl-CoA dioxygenase PhyH [Oharaeibacter diazotrophicus]BBE74730.1 phytanoyl-CoA dioxygenase PhyH [Pleomorphomonas sp. SM30]GLS77112.1 hypothetical protein GCM10007904_24490 [Oharaeibacter diazotrophicus]
MKTADWLKAPLWLWGLAGTSKSFRANPLIGDPGLNARGLHRERVALAWRMAERRRAAIASRVAPEHRRQFDENGFVVVENYLPDDVFARMVASLRTTALPAREMRQGETVTRMIPLGPSVLARLPEVRGVVRDREIGAAIRYAASTAGPPVWFVQTVIAEPGRGRPDPQCDVHADTFHPTAKMWLFLQDVGPDDGPFRYVPGSHRLTPARLDWEYRTSLTARDDPRLHHAHGSFRVRPDELAAMGFPEPRVMTVRANTLVIADTFGFHARTPSPKPTLRMELHAYLRLAPFSPFAWPGVRALPGVSARQLDLYLGWTDAQARLTGRGRVWKPVGEVTADSPAHL